MFIKLKSEYSIKSLHNLLPDEGCRIIRKFFLPLLITTSYVVFSIFLMCLFTRGVFDEHAATRKVILKFDEKEVSLDHKNIFHVVTSSFGRFEFTLNPRSACTVESAAKMNPNMTIYLLCIEQCQVSKSFKDLAEQLLRYDNVKIRRISIENYSKNTPSEKWILERNVMKNSSISEKYWHEVMKYLTLWKFGGIFLDFDNIVIKSLQDLMQFVVIQDDETVSNSVLGFSTTNLRKKIAHECLTDLQKIYQQSDWAEDGVLLVTRALKKICHANNLKRLQPNECKVLKILTQSEFYRIHWLEWEQYFSLKNISETTESIKKARILQVWSAMNETPTFTVISKVFYGLVVRESCPYIFKNFFNEYFWETF